MRAISKYKPPWVLNAEVLTCIYGGAYFRNFTVPNWEHQNALLRCYTAVKLGPPTRDSIGASLASTSGRDHITNSEVLARAGIVSIHPLFSHGRLRRLGHVYYMDDERVPRKKYSSTLLYWLVKSRIETKLVRPSQSICSGTAMSCLAVKALSVLSVLLIHTRPEAVSPIERLLFCLIQFLFFLYELLCFLFKFLHQWRAVGSKFKMFFLCSLLVYSGFMSSFNTFTRCNSFFKLFS